MHYSPILKILGFPLILLGLSLLIPLIYAYVTADQNTSAFFWAFIISITAGILLSLIPSQKKGLNYVDGCAIVTFGWSLIALVGSLPYLFSIHDISLADAFFESMSGFTTTGSSILRNIEEISRPLLLWRSMTQWLGGMGIIVLVIAIIPYFDLGGMSIYQAEVPGPRTEKITPRIQDTSRSLWLLYTILTCAAGISFYLGGMDWFDALNHGMTTIASGGFSTKNASMAAFPTAFIQWTCMFFMVLTAINFTLHFHFFFRDNKWVSLRNYYRDTELRSFIIILFASSGAIVGAIFFSLGGYTVENADGLRAILLQIVSIATTTGYSSTDYEIWPITAQIIIIFLMIIGGCAGSTAGGLKVIRILLMLKYIYIQLLRIIHPNIVKSIKLEQYPVEDRMISGTLSFLLIYGIILSFSVLIVSWDSAEILTPVSAVISALGNIGPGFGSVGPTQNFYHLGAISKCVLSLNMLMGRLEIFSVIVIFLPHTWRR